MSYDQVIPDYAGGSIVNLAASLVAAYGIKPPSLPCRETLIPVAALNKGNNIVLVVCDGSGYQQLQQAMQTGRTPNLSRLAEIAPHGMQQLTSVFPSTTTVALTSLSCARTPSEHGIMGHRQWIDELQSLCNMLKFTTEATCPVPFDEELVRTVPTVYELLSISGICSYTISAAQYEGTAFTSLITRGSTFRGYQTQSEIALLLEKSIKETTESRAFYSLYWPMIDTLSHIYGPLCHQDPSQACLFEFEFIDLMLGHISDCCRRHGCSLVITADHGQIPLDPKQAIQLDNSTTEAIKCAPGGGRRALYLATNNPDDLVQHFLRTQKEIQWILTKEAISQGWLGGHCQSFLSRLGDIIAFPKGKGQLLYDYGQGIHLQKGAHGGLSPEEMLVPLLAIPADAW